MQTAPSATETPPSGPVASPRHRGYSARAHGRRIQLAPVARTGGRGRAAAAWVAWTVVIFLLFNVGATHRAVRAMNQAEHEGVWTHTPANILTAVRAYFTDDGDVRRYFAYCNAALGRP